ncbi:hypothetical protein AVEN_16771-1 [Araneus ventricosus]|uniref:Pre-C2HC domain-containing protein n=1 Tax=Araneus ventricosus TaxID=182803 RepID=A0A4Y2BPV7_ARAVE|nr:hypothetical protein AVEN_16771-1 [Araneus ventricosus]
MKGKLPKIDAPALKNFTRIVDFAPKDFDEPLKCASCSGDHAANWRQCPRFPKPAGNKNQRAKLIHKQARNLIDTPSRTQPPPNSRKVSSEVSYAEMATGNTKEPSIPMPIPNPPPQKISPRFPVKFWPVPSLKHSQRSFTS